jgi:hypothetical protein
MGQTMPNDSTSEFIVSDAITDSEQRFPFKDLLSLDYFKRHRAGYYDCREHGWQIPKRNYYNLLTFLTEIHEYRPDDAKAFAKRFRTEVADLSNADATFAEMIVYRYYVRLVYEGLIRAVRLGRGDCDVVIERLDASCAFLEVFSVKPKFPEIPPGEKFVAYDIRTHTQNAMASVRQKLLRKISEQNQMTKPRENYAVIELNDPSIAGNFSVLSSLSSGYKVTIDLRTMKAVNAGYDWTSSVFDDEALRYLKSVIVFDLGDYESRRFVDNPRYQRAGNV